MTEHSIPHIGMRIIKSAVAVLFCLWISMLLDIDDMRIYSPIAALFCVQPYAGDTRRMAIQRTTGTLIGSAVGVLILLLAIVLGIRGTVAGYTLVAAGIVPVIWISVTLKAANAAALSGIVFLSITVPHDPDVSPWLFTLHRMSDTLIGIAVGIAVNAARFPRRKRRDTLFVSGLDGVLLTENETVTSYAVVHLNRLLDDGMRFTLSTMRTPAFIRETLPNLRFRLPVIVMDGAALYNMKEKRYLHTCILPKELVLRCEEIFRAKNVHCFLNGVMDDNMMIYYGEFHNDTEREIFRKLRASPYRNYVSRSYYNHCPILYLMGIDRTERMQELYGALESSGLLAEVKARFYPSTVYPGYSYLKIYERGASREAMLEQLKRDIGVQKSVMLSAQEGCGDILVRGGGNKAVKQLEHLYAPYFWRRG